MDNDRVVDRLSPETLERLRSSGRQIATHVGDVVFHEGESSDSVYLVESGLLKITKVAADGRSSLLGLRRNGALVGEQAALDGRPRSASVTALQHGVLVVVSGTAFKQLLEECPDLSLMLLHQLSTRLRETSARMLEFATADAVSRVASRLTDLVSDDQLRSLGEDHTGSIELRLPISQAELAEWSGLSRESIVKALRELRAQGLIETARKAVIIHDFDRLQAMGLDAFYPM